MKSFFTYLARLSALALVFVLFGSCCQNNGHIGKLFGSWSLVELDVDGRAVTFPDGEYTTLSFQNDIVMVVFNDELQNSWPSVGTWRRHDSILEFDFPSAVISVTPSVESFVYPEWLQIPTGHSEYLLIELTGRRLEFMRTDKGGREYVYKYDKTW